MITENVGRFGDGSTGPTGAGATNRVTARKRRRSVVLFRGEVDDASGSAGRRAADPLFLLPRPVTSACVVGDVPRWRAALVGAGIEVVPEGELAAHPADVVIARDVRRALAVR